MKTLLMCTALMVAVPVTAAAEAPDEEFNRLVDEVLEITGALRIGEQLGQALVGQMYRALKDADSQLPDAVFDIIEEEVNAAMAEELESGSYQQLMYPIYAKHLRKSDLEAAVAFYRSEAGQRIAAATPMMAQAGMVAGQQWGQSLGPKIGQRVMDRLAAERHVLE